MSLRVSTAQVPLETYGNIFESQPADSAVVTGRQFLSDAVRILENRLPRNQSLRKLPLTPQARIQISKYCLTFLKMNDHSPFEHDNLNHVGRLLGNMKRFGGDLKVFLDIDVEDIQCLAALHDLGKADTPKPMYQALVEIFGQSDFVNLRVLPHELFSMYFIHELGLELKLDPLLTETLIDQVSNHNFGPKLSDPFNQHLIAKNSEGKYKHWWLENWAAWTAQVNAAGLRVNPLYGNPESPLATALVLFDRIDNGHPHAWEKFLNQDLISGKLQFTASTLIPIFEKSTLSSREQIKAVGRQLRFHFTGSKKNASIEDFPPYVETHRMLNLNESVVNRLQESNEPIIRAQFNIQNETSILYQDRNQIWTRVDHLADQSGNHATQFQWQDGKWNVKEQAESPVAMLLETVYRDWNLNI